MRKLYAWGLAAILLSASGGAVACAQGRGFVPVQGQTLPARVDEALKLARARAARSRFWLAYEFNLRGGVAIDSVPGLSGVATGKVGEFETRRAGLFMLYEPGAASPSEIKVLSLDQTPAVGGLPAFWLEKSANEESLQFLQGLLKARPSGPAAQQAVVAIALHDDPSVAAVLRQVLQNSQDVPVRTTAVAWLGRLPGQLPLLAELAREGREQPEVRHAAVTAIAKGREPAFLSTLEDLYNNAAADRDLKAHIIRVAAKSEDKGAAAEFLVKVAENEPDEDLRRQALTSINKKLYRRKARQ
ncbi:MAG TPA: HEAT repeat domain-containing protein [Pyrinomonadaceae bacterium]|jgi:hypothetical protein